MKNFRCQECGKVKNISRKWSMDATTAVGAGVIQIELVTDESWKAVQSDKKDSQGKLIQLDALQVCGHCMIKLMEQGIEILKKRDQIKPDRNIEV